MDSINIINNYIKEEAFIIEQEEVLKEGITNIIKLDVAKCYDAKEDTPYLSRLNYSKQKDYSIITINKDCFIDKDCFTDKDYSTAIIIDKDEGQAIRHYYIDYFNTTTY